MCDQIVHHIEQDWPEVPPEYIRDAVYIAAQEALDPSDPLVVEGIARRVVYATEGGKNGRPNRG